VAEVRSRVDARRTVTVVVQVNGKVRDRLQVPTDNSEDANVALALSREPVLGRV
jgi:leucyl-tRNA synthetase